MRTHSVKRLGVVVALVLASAGAGVAATTPPATVKDKTPVADAAMRGDVASVRRLIAQGQDVNASQGDGMTALHWAADHGDSAMASALVRSKANVRAVTRIGAYTPLHIAARVGNAAVVRVLLAGESDVKATTTSGATALHLAAAAGNADVVKALLSKGADPNARESSWGQTPLIFAAEYNRAAAVKALLAGGADPSIRTRAVNLSELAAREQAADKRRNAVLISFEPKARHDSAEADYKKSVDAARAAAAAANPQPARPAAPAAGDSASRARGDSAGASRPAPAPPVQREPRGPFTPAQIQAAIDSGRAVLEAPSAPSDTAKEQVDTANGGVQGYVKQVGAMGGLVALHHAVRQGSLDAAMALVDGGANINDTSYVDRTTPLLMATINGQFDVAMQLVARGANPNIASTAGMTPLYAVINSQWAPRTRYPQPQAIQTQKTAYMDLVTALIDKGADVNARLKKQPWYFAYNNCGNANCGLENIDGTTPFWRAAYSLDVDAMKLLVAKGADPSIPSTPPPPAVRGARPPAPAAPARAAGDAPDTARAAEKAAPNATVASGPNVRPAGGPAAAAAPARAAGGDGAAFKNDPEIDALAKVAPVGAGVLPIHAAAGVGYGNGFAGNSHRHAPGGWMPALKYLVEELHADVNARDNNGYTPLHHAAARGDNEMIKYLVAHGANVMAVSRNGRTVVDMANGPVQRVRPYPETIELLEKLGAKNQHHCVSC
ncbi:MAG TPA: ankyrin repeat domain-containing protein [Gemmatimonadaceae bacterium]|nr:ankyrin repeat domain-containing protein [Gemmatimonadaceae bacterium]